MNYANPYGAARQYANVGAEAVVADADPHRLIQLLFENARGRIAAAKGHMQRGEVSMKGEAIGRAIGIVEGLRDALNMDAGGEVARNLDELYEYAAQRLLEGNLRNDVACLDEIAALLVEIQGAWEAIAPRPATPGHAP
ncbi:MAG: flagellar export chaperone FliS [Gammaproteobacteria bacterium]|nr:flagellar export chaperone FliS [Gammaproteobacteria bacterium]